MRILAVSVAPLFPDRVMGGSQRVLLEVVDVLAEAGHEVRLLSPELAGGVTEFQTEAGALISPVLQLRGSFPAPYQTAPHRLGSVWQVLAENAQWAERVYLHADAIYMRNALGDLPIVRSLHDFVYEEALLSAFTLRAERTIVPSRYMADCISASAGRVFDVGEITVIPNGVAVHSWPVLPHLPPGIAPRGENDIILLHPHRLQPEKGVRQSMLIAAELQKRHPEKRVRLLVPALQPDGSADDAELQSGSVLDIARSVGAENLAELHRWLSPQQMPAYYASGDVTLCPGSFVEAFGLVPLESVAAGTPSLCARVGALREHEGVAGVSHFDYGDIGSAVDGVEHELERTADHEADARAVVAKYSLTEMRASYIEAITGELRSTASRSVDWSHDTTEVSLAPWCYVTGDRIYHDYLARFESFPLLAAELGKVSGAKDALLINVSEASDPLKAEINLALKDGYLVPS